MAVSFYHDIVNLYLTDISNLLLSSSAEGAIKLLAPAKHKSSLGQIGFWSRLPSDSF